MSIEKQRFNRIKMLTYFALCQNLINFIDAEWTGHPANRQSVKSASKVQLRELEKAMNVLFPPNLNDVRDGADVIDTFINATDAMENFFTLGMMMDEMPTETKQELNDKIDKLLISYGIDFWNKPISSLWAK